MRKQIVDLNNELCSLLAGRTMTDDRKYNVEISSEEKNSIERALMLRKEGDKKVVVKISKRYHLDFVGWNDTDHFDVLLCKN